LQPLIQYPLSCQPAIDSLTQLAAESEAFLSVIDPDDVFLHARDMPEKIRSYYLKTDQRVPRAVVRNSFVSGTSPVLSSRS